VAYWKTLHSDPDAKFDAVVELDAAQIIPQVTWGTSPEMVLGVDARVPDPDKEKDANKRGAIERALTYMGLEPGKALDDIHVDKVFIGSCTNSRIEDMREAAAVVKKLGQKVARNVKLAMVVPGSGLVKEQAEREGLHEIFKAAGFEWREPGCSMCLAMNADRLEPGERCASTSNRNFEGRQGAGGRTHLVSPAMAARPHGHFVASANFVDIRKPRLQHGQMQEIREMQKFTVHTRAWWPRWTARTSTPTRSSPSSSSSPSARPASASTCLTNGATWTRLSRPGPGQPQAQPGLRAEPAALRGRLHPAGPQELRLRLVARARALGAGPIRLSRHHRAQLCRHLLQQQLQERPAAHRAARATVDQLFDEARPSPATSSRSIWSAR
jgi:hypothetical protein